MAKPMRMTRTRRLERELARTNFERVLGNASQMAMVVVGIVIALVAIQSAQFILAPLLLAVTIGLMFGPLADMLERRGVPEALSAGVVVLLLLGVIAGAAALFYGPLAEWSQRLPVIWQRLQNQLANLKEPMESLGALQEQLKGVLGADEAVQVRVEDSSAVTGIALMAPAIFAQVLIFLASLYFFMATRDNIRIATLSLCVSRRMRWRTAHVFRDVEEKVSRYLLTITMVNVGVGVVVSLLMLAIGMPSPLLWGALAAVLNYIPFVGQGFMALVLFLVGMGSAGGLDGALLAVGLYWSVNFVEGNFVTPNLLGRTMTVNPFLIFLSLTFWLWVWGPVGGLIAVPSLLVLLSVITHILPTRRVTPRRAARRLAAKASADATEATPKVLPPEPESGRQEPTSGLAAI